MNVRLKLLWQSFAFLPLVVGLAATEFPTPTGFVNDFAGVLNQSARTQLDARLQTFERQTTTEIAIAILPTLDGRTIEDVSVRLFEQWRIGKRDKNNGILIVVAVRDHRVRIEVGYGLEGKVPDAQAGRIIREVMAPRFRDGDYAGGLNAAVDQLTRLISGTPAPPPVSDARSPRARVRDSPIAWLIAGGLYLVVLAVRGAAGVRRCPRCGTGMRRTVAPQATLAGNPNTVVHYVCPRCGYTDLRVERPYVGSVWGGTGWSSGGFGGGGFGGFGGGSSGGGGASGSW